MSLATKGLIDEPFGAEALIRWSTAIKAITLLYVCKTQVLVTVQFTICVSPLLKK